MHNKKTANKTTMAVDERSAVSFLIPQVTLLWQLIFVGLSASINIMGLCAIP